MEDAQFLIRVEERGTVRVVNLSADDEAGVHESPSKRVWLIRKPWGEEERSVRKKTMISMSRLTRESIQTQRFMLSSCNKNTIIAKRVLFILYNIAISRELSWTYVSGIPDFLRIFKLYICICIYFISSVDGIELISQV